MVCNLSVILPHIHRLLYKDGGSESSGQERHADSYWGAPQFITTANGNRSEGIIVTTTVANDPFDIQLHESRSHSRSRSMQDEEHTAYDSESARHKSHIPEVETKKTGVAL